MACNLHLGSFLHANGSEVKTKAYLEELYVMTRSCHPQKLTWWVGIRVCLDKRKGELGVRSLVAMNEALPSKWA